VESRLVAILFVLPSPHKVMDALCSKELLLLCLLDDGVLLGKWIYCVGEDSMLYIFDALSGILENVLELTDKEGREVN
jgi:hypothetical protein